jgi:hypothetical protein
MIRITPALAGLVLLATPALADDAHWISSWGDAYMALENPNGVILTSVYPKFWFVEQGADSYVVDGPDMIFLGKSCDAYHKVFGDGAFSWGNGGFRAEFEDGTVIGFPRQEMPWAGLMDCMN